MLKRNWKPVHPNNTSNTRNPVHGFIDLTGKAFGHLLVARRHSVNSKHNQPLWECKCDCENICFVRGDLLRNEIIKSCGCQRWNPKPPYFWLLSIIKRNSKKRNIEFSITHAELKDFTTITACHYCTAPIDWETRKKSNSKGGYFLDRKDNSKGYIAKNCVVCCPRCNYSKGDYFSYLEWLKMTEPFRNGILIPMKWNPNDRSSQKI